MTSTASTAEVHRCMRCGRRLRTAKSIAAGYGAGCRARIRAAAKLADLSQWTPVQVEDARQAIEDGAVVPSTREGVFHVVSSDGTEVHLTHRNGCNCANGLRTLPPRPCWHRCSVAMVLADIAPAPASAPVAVPVPPAVPDDIWAALDAMGATSVYAVA